MTEPRVLVGTYLYSGKHYSFEKFLDATLKTMADYSGDTELLIVDNSEDKEYASLVRLICDGRKEKDKITVAHIKEYGSNSRLKQKTSQEVLWDYCLNNQYDYLYIIESDIYVPVDSLRELVSHKKKIISGIYSLSNDDVQDILCLMGYNRNADGKMYWEAEQNLTQLIEITGGKPLKVYACGLGCILIHKEILKTIKPWYSTLSEANALGRLMNNAKVLKTPQGKYVHKLLKKLEEGTRTAHEQKVHPDSYFHKMCELYKVNRYVTTNVICEHNRSNWSECKVKR
jgi:hypothetical protein